MSGITDPVEGADDRRKKGMLSLTNDGRIELTRKGKSAIVRNTGAVCDPPLLANSPSKCGKTFGHWLSCPSVSVDVGVDIVGVVYSLTASHKSKMKIDFVG
jgi:hypothetical protein